jgi:hypothetical protein
MLRDLLWNIAVVALGFAAFLGGAVGVVAMLGERAC